ncbi:response regulator transcription factor [bacterium]|nr:MAG: response regulator transcription factor [bacterium]
MSTIKISIVEDNPGIRESLSLLIDSTDGFELCKAYPNAEAAMDDILVNTPNIVLMDINLPNRSGIDCTVFIKEHRPTIQVLIQTVYEDADLVFNALRAGATGYMLKRSSPSELIEAIHDCMNGGAPMSSAIARKVVQSFHTPLSKPDPLAELSSREEEVLQQLSKGFRNKEIAENLFISVETVRRHVHTIYTKLHVRSRTEAVLKYLGSSSS